MDDTLLVIAGMGVPPYSARGLTQTLEPIEASAALRRTVNGVLHDLSLPQFRKYRSTISCTDQRTPAIDAIWPGQVVTVDCVVELASPIGVTLDRTAVAQRTEGGFTFYQPRLTMMVVSYRISLDEWGADYGWQLDLEQV